MAGFNLKALVAPAVCIGVGMGCMIGGERIYYHQGRAGLPFTLATFWGGLLLLVCGAIWFLIRVSQQATRQNLLTCIALIAVEVGALAAYYFFVVLANWFII